MNGAAQKRRWTMTAELVDLGGVRLEVHRRGEGSPLLLLPGEEMLELEAPFLDELAADHELIIPAPPGFGRSERPDWITSPDDISYLYLDLVERLALRRLLVVGCSLGGWLAAELATKNASFIERLILVAPYGVKVGGPTDRDIADIWMLPRDRVMALKWFDPQKGRRDYRAMPEERLAIIARNSESFARFCWEPYMHNPELRHRLHRVTPPALLVWGENDGIVTPDYGRAYAAMIPGARFELIRAAGHYPHLEQPGEFIQRLRAFLQS
jgi:pimeloyl-ACP methyl ester carboxylesterase